MIKEYRSKKRLQAIQWLGNNIEEVNEFLRYDKEDYTIDKDANIIYWHSRFYETRIIIGDYITYEEEEFNIDAFIHHYKPYPKEKFEKEFEEVN